MKDIISDAILAAMICNHKTFFLASPLHIVSHDYHGQRLDTDSSQHYQRLDTDGAGVLGDSLRVSGLDPPDDDDASRVDGLNSDALKQITNKGVHHNNKMDEPKNEDSTELNSQAELQQDAATKQDLERRIKAISIEINRRYSNANEIKQNKQKEEDKHEKNLPEEQRPQLDEPTNML